MLLVAGALVVVGCGGDVGEPGPGTNASRSSGAEGDDDEADAGGKKELGESGCAADDECASGVCFKGNSQSFCTVRCTSDDVTTTCAAPLSGKCNKQGFCKRD